MNGNLDADAGRFCQACGTFSDCFFTTDAVEVFSTKNFPISRLKGRLSTYKLFLKEIQDYFMERWQTEYEHRHFYRWQKKIAIKVALLTQGSPPPSSSPSHSFNTKLDIFAKKNFPSSIEFDNKRGVLSLKRKQQPSKIFFYTRYFYVQEESYFIYFR